MKKACNKFSHIVIYVSVYNFFYSVGVIYLTWPYRCNNMWCISFNLPVHVKVVCVSFLFDFTSASLVHLLKCICGRKTPEP